MTLSILDKNNNRKLLIQTGIVYLSAAVLTALFGIVYECFSHNVFSPYMTFAFLVPLVGGAILLLVIGLAHGKKVPGLLSRNLFHCSAATFTLGSLMNGVLEIYGTTNDLINIYWIVGGILAGSSILFYVVSSLFMKPKTEVI